MDRTFSWVSGEEMEILKVMQEEVAGFGQKNLVVRF